MTDVLGGIVLMMMLITLVASVGCGIRALVERTRRRKRSAWYRIDSARNKRLDYRDFYGHFVHSEKRDYLREFADVSAFHRRQAN